MRSVMALRASLMAALTLTQNGAGHGGDARSIVPSPEPTAPMPRKKASRAKS
jgi:hypothetical protein